MDTIRVDHLDEFDRFFMDSDTKLLEMYLKVFFLLFRPTRRVT